MIDMLKWKRRCLSISVRWHSDSIIVGCCLVCMCGYLSIELNIVNAFLIYNYCLCRYRRVQKVFLYLPTNFTGKCFSPQLSSFCKLLTICLSTRCWKLIPVIVTLNTNFEAFVITESLQEHTNIFREVKIFQGACCILVRLFYTQESPLSRWLVNVVVHSLCIGKLASP